MIRLGIIGCGAVTERHHLPALERVRDIEVVALADEDQRRLTQLGQRGRACYSTSRELINDPGIDAVAICLPPLLHVEVALAALQKGKHLFIEKPLALTLAGCDQLIEASQAHPSRKVMVGFNLRWHRLVRQARHIINRNELGPIKLVRTVFTSGNEARANKGRWRDLPGAGGGVIFDLGVHHFDLVRFLLGSEAAEIHPAIAGSDKAATVLFSMRNGTQVECAFAEGPEASHAFEVYGERGRLRVSLYRTDGLERFRLNEQEGAISAGLRFGVNRLLSLPRMLYQAGTGGEFATSYVEEWNHFAEAVLRDKPVEADLLAGRRALEIALDAMREK